MFWKKEKSRSEDEIVNEVVDDIQKIVIKELTHLRKEEFNQFQLKDRYYIELILKIEQILYDRLENFRR